MKGLTPVQLLALLTVHICPDAHQKRVVQARTEELINLGLLGPTDIREKEDTQLHVTKKGVAYLTAIREIPMPVAQYVIPDTTKT